MKKLFTLLLILLSFIGFATWQYRLLCLLVLVMIWKKNIKASQICRRYKYGYLTLVSVLLLGIWTAIPNYWQRGRTQLVYLDNLGKKSSVPLHIYLANVLFPEEEVMNFGIKSAALLPGGLKVMGHNLEGRLARDAQRDFWTLKGINFYAPYNRLSLTGSNPGSFTIAQAWNGLTGGNLNGIYITRPKNYDSEKKYPVVFFAHGFLGSWELYNGLLNRLEDCFVISIGTRDMSGIFTYSDIEKCFSQYLPYLKEQGYNIDKDNLHFMGLSNGGTAADVALQSFSNRFSSITYISTGCHVKKYSKAKVLMVGGGKDESSAGLPSAKRQLERYGTDTSIYWAENENHFVLVHKINEITEFFNKELKL